MSKNVLITGGSGFLGCHVSRALLKKGYTVTIYDLANLDATDLIGKVTVIKGDIRDKKSLAKALVGKTYVVHAAAALPILQSKEHIYSTNVTGTKNVLEASLEQKIQRLVFISTTAVYGVPKHLPEKENSPLDPIGYYGKSKIEGENLCKQYIKKGLEINIIRPKTFVGPERLGVFELWYEAIYTGKRVYLLGKGDNPYQLLAVSDVVNAIILALTTKTKNEIFNIGAEKFETWRKDLAFVIQYAKSKSRITGLPVLPSQIILSVLEYLHLSPIAAWHYKTMPAPSYVSTEKAEKLLKWKAEKSNKELLLENYKWYEKNRNIVSHKIGTTHRVGWDFKLLNLVKIFG